jgi:hypothetical protein
MNEFSNGKLARIESQNGTSNSNSHDSNSNRFFLYFQKLGFAKSNIRTPLPEYWVYLVLVERASLGILLRVAGQACPYTLPRDMVSVGWWKRGWELYQY